MRIDNRKGWIVFWDVVEQVSVVAPLIGWEGDTLEELMPVFNFMGTSDTVLSDWELHFNHKSARKAAKKWDQQ